ncbi:hypothetical protein BDV24DRAFT_159501 [Aspergillus arachidicola]|uniref:Zn(2)-C6 fungal-type domain-containing protein n=1 Tax=Aspergillus arachidicola TaxID=656916 RepID=A0A2G7G1Z1_9EURO|nr:hypothetical protein BDV24DRAFT_159501 [Aspergillus arachidicola]PIG86615.1 hypothetical protein AARAC_006103 [Aspergillus arachidicola]
MVSDAPKRVTLRRSCQACVRGKRRCDQLWPRCSRCHARGIECEYVNVPLPTGPDTSNVTSRSVPRVASVSALPIHRPLPLVIMKGYDREIISFLIAGMRSFPIEFANNMKTEFIHPHLCQSSEASTVFEDVQALCRLHTQASQGDTPTSLTPLLQQHCAELLRKSGRPASFQELLACIQSLLILQCLLIFGEKLADDSPYSETISSMLSNVGRRLWQQAPIQLSHTLSPREAWLFAESVRRTIIVAFMLRSVYSLLKRNYSVRTPFVDSLPFDVRTSLWDVDHEAWDDATSASLENMISMQQYSTLLESGAVHGISPFSALILAACKGKSVSDVPYPPITGYEAY